MRLSDYENEEALDLLADLIDPAARIMADKKVEAMVKSKKPALLIASHILKKHKKESIEIVSALHREDPGKYRFTAISLLNDLLDILNDEQVIGLFTSQGQTTERTYSGSATESTEESEQ